MPVSHNVTADSFISLARFLLHIAQHLDVVTSSFPLAYRDADVVEWQLYSISVPLAFIYTRHFSARPAARLLYTRLWCAFPGGGGGGNKKNLLPPLAHTKRTFYTNSVVFNFAQFFFYSFSLFVVCVLLVCVFYILNIFCLACFFSACLLEKPWCSA